MLFLETFGDFKETKIKQIVNDNNLTIYNPRRRSN